MARAEGGNRRVVPWARRSPDARAQSSPFQFTPLTQQTRVGSAQPAQLSTIAVDSGPGWLISAFGVGLVWSTLIRKIPNHKRHRRLCYRDPQATSTLGLPSWGRSDWWLVTGQATTLHLCGHPTPFSLDLADTARRWSQSSRRVNAWTSMTSVRSGPSSMSARRTHPSWRPIANTPATCATARSPQNKQ